MTFHSSVSSTPSLAAASVAARVVAMAARGVVQLAVAAGGSVLAAELTYVHQLDSWQCQSET